MLFPAINLSGRNTIRMVSDTWPVICSCVSLPDGTQTTFATLDDILIDEVKTVKSGAVRFTIAIPTEGHRSGHYTCLLKDGRITVRSATDDVFYIWGNDALENEQEKIDKIIANQKGEE